MLRAIEWILLGAGSTAAIVAGVRRHRPSQVMPWLLLAASVASLGIGDVLYATDRRDAAEGFYLAMFGLVGAGLVQFTRDGSLLVDRARLIDLLAATCALLLVAWVFMVSSSHELGKIPPADVVGDLVLIGVAGRLVIAAGRNASACLLLTGAIGMLAADVLYPLLPGPFPEFGYVVLYVTWALAALHPSMTRLTQPMPPRPSPWRGRWAALLGVSVATPPAVLLYESLDGTVRDGVLIAVVGAITLLLTITRLADSIHQNSQALSRERGLRAASTALVSAADVDAVDEAVRAAVDQLMPATYVRQVVFAADDRTLTLEALTLEALTLEARPLKVRPLKVRPLAVRPVGARPADPAGPRPRSWWLDEANSVEATLICPLWLEPLAVARPSGGALILTGRRDALTVSRDSLEVLAGQAALALDRITLVAAVGRRDSDLYLRAVIHNTADMMLVIDEDQRIRYTSPALRDLLGSTELSPLATFEDLVHPQDRGQVRRALLADGDGKLFIALQRPDETQVLVEATYRDLREDRLVQGFVVTVRDVTGGHDPVEQMPHVEHVDELPAWVNRRSAQHKFRY